MTLAFEAVHLETFKTTFAVLVHVCYLTEKRHDPIFIGKINGNKGRKIHQQLNEKYLTLSFAIVSKFFGRVSTSGCISS